MLYGAEYKLFREGVKQRLDHISAMLPISHMAEVGRDGDVFKTRTHNNKGRRPYWCVPSTATTRVAMIRPRTLVSAMSHTTRATQFLESHSIRFTLAEYVYDPNADRIGMAAAEAMGVEPARVLKTLMATVDGKPVCAIVPSDCEVAMKKLAAAFGGKSAAMMKPADAERLTGYHVGGISPFGQKKPVPTVLEELAQVFDEVYLNGGQRGLQVKMAPCDIVRGLNAVTAAIIA